MLPMVTTNRSTTLNAALAPVNLNAGPLRDPGTSWPNTSPLRVVTISVLPMLTTNRSTALKAIGSNAAICHLGSAREHDIRVGTRRHLWSARSLTPAGILLDAGGPSGRPETRGFCRWPNEDFRVRRALPTRGLLPGDW